MTNILQQLSDEMADTSEAVRQSLVRISNGRWGLGAGVIWQKDGLIVTNAHVVAHGFRGWGRRGPGKPTHMRHRGRGMRGRRGWGHGPHQHHHSHGHHGEGEASEWQQISVVLNGGERYDADVLAVDLENDIALLRIDADNLPEVTLGNSQDLRAGEYVMAMGHPWGVQNAVTGGNVIGVGSDLPEMMPGREWIALNLRLRPGHSGGPLVDAEGRLLGVNTMISGPEVGFAVPVNVVKQFVDNVLSGNYSPPQHEGDVRSDEVVQI